MKKLISVVVVTLVTLTAFADMQQVAPGSKAEEVAQRASDVFSVTYLNAGELSYKIVGMDTALNGDLSSTTMLLVGEGGVGGAAGYEAAFQLSPEEGRQNLKSVKLVGKSIKLVFSNIDGKDQTITVQYDKSSKTLKVK